MPFDWLLDCCMLPLRRFEKHLPVRLIKEKLDCRANSKTTTSSPSPSSEFCSGCRRHLPRTKFPLSSGAVVGRCVNCVQLDNNARSGHDLSAFKDMMERVKAAEEREDNTTSPVFQLQVHVRTLDCNHCIDLPANAGNAIKGKSRVSFVKW